MAGYYDPSQAVYPGSGVDIQPGSSGYVGPGDQSGSTPGVNQSGLGGFMQGVGQFLTGSNNPFTNASLIPAMAMAAQQWHNAGQYTDLGNRAAAMANPMGDRSQYVNELSALEKDPSQIANTPGYKFALNQAMDATSSKLASQGLLGSSQMQNALATESSGLAQQTYNNTINQLSRLAGADFNPAQAASMMMQGGELSMGAQNAALAAMFYPFGPGAGNGSGVTINNNNSGGGGGQGGGSSGAGGHLGSALSQAVQGGFIKPGDAASLFQRIMADPSNISPADLQLMQSLGIQTPFDTGGVDTAPPSYDPTGGFGGYGNVDPTTGAILDSQTGSPFDSSNIFGAGYPIDPSTIDPGTIDTSGFTIDPWSGGG